MDKGGPPSLQKPYSSLPELKLSPKSMEAVRELSDLYLPKSAEAIDLSDYSLIGNLYSLLIISRQKGSRISKKHAKDLENIVISAEGGSIHVVNRIVRLFRKEQNPTPGRISQAYARLYQPSEAITVDKNMAGLGRIEADGKQYGLEKVKELCRKYSDFVQTAVSTLREMGHENPTSQEGIIALWKDVSSIIWSNFSQAEPISSHQNNLASCVLAEILNCDTSGFPTADIMAHFGVQSSQVYVSRGEQKSGHAINRCYLPGKPDSVFIETRAEFPGYFLNSLAFGTYSSLDEVLDKYPLLYGEISYGEKSERFGLRESAIRRALKERLDDAIEEKPHSISNYWNYIIRGCLHWSKGQLEPAKEDFEKAISLSPSTPEGHLHLSKLTLCLDFYGNYLGSNYAQSITDSIKVVNQGIKKNRESAELYAELGRLCGMLTWNGQTLPNADEIQAYTSAIALSPKAAFFKARANAYAKKANTAKYVGNDDGNALELYGKAISDLEKASELEPWNNNIYVELSELIMKELNLHRDSTPEGPAYGKERIEISKKHVFSMWESALEKNPSDAQLRISYARFLRSHPFFSLSHDLGLESIDNAVKLAKHSEDFSSSASILANRAHLDDEKYTMRIFELYRKAIAANPKKYQPYAELSHFLDRLSKIKMYGKGSRDEFSGIYALYPNKGMGNISLDVLEEGAKRNPFDPRFQEAIAWNYAELGLYHSDRIAKHLGNAIWIYEQMSDPKQDHDGGFHKKMMQLYSDLAGAQAFHRDLEGSKASIAKAEEYMAMWKKIEDEKERRQGKRIN